MKIELTQEQAQTVIDNQAAEIEKLKLRLVKAHVTTKYITRATARLSSVQIKTVISHLNVLIADDEDEFRYNHDSIREIISRYENISSEIPIISYLFQFAINGHDHIKATNLDYEIERLMTEYLWQKGEPETPNFFSSSFSF